MNYYILSFLALILCGCVNSTVTNFRVQAIAEQGVSEQVARKIALIYGAQKLRQDGHVKIHVYSRGETAKKECLETKSQLEIHGEFCNASYFIATEYDFGYSSYLVLEKCLNSICHFHVGQVNIGIEE